MGFWRTLLSRGVFGARFGARPSFGASRHELSGDIDYSLRREAAADHRRPLALRTRASRDFSAAGLALCAAMGVGGCAIQSYAGISLKPGAAPTDLQSLAGRAKRGDKQAQFELGQRFERGDGVPRNLHTAITLYRAAASDSGGARMIYIPATGGRRAAVVPKNLGRRVAGIDAAKVRLAALQADNSPSSPIPDSDNLPKLRSVVGTATYVGLSDVCEDDRETLQAAVRYTISKCSSDEYVLRKKDGSQVTVIDLMMFTSDDVEIPSGMFRLYRMPPDIQISGKPQFGKLTYRPIQTKSATINVVWSFEQKGK